MARRPGSLQVLTTAPAGVSRAGDRDRAPVVGAIDDVPAPLVELVRVRQRQPEDDGLEAMAALLDGHGQVCLGRKLADGPEAELAPSDYDAEVARSEEGLGLTRLVSLASGPSNQADDRDENAEREDDRTKGRDPLTARVPRPCEDGECLVDDVKKPLVELVGRATAGPGALLAPAKPSYDRPGDQQDDAHY